ncbi:GIY-YIG nuclease family protein [Variovorax saccharolyticus]|uniref:GIY-YIG nuclease family protein n=1 Tax=Variovorax saccharolyticus TaxID=3053516 RepID=UPI0025779B9C|nr:GIY-YIG nuclease family protein [Variovorax sp. J22R187]MDM0018913.1 GIY-YIG nuclease family protein [Variovorax sp. J22R187]
MDHPAIFAEQPFTGMLAAGPSQEAFEILDEAFAGEVGRSRMQPRRASPRRAAPRRPPRPAPRASSQRRPPPQRPPPRPRPRPPSAWPPVAGGGYPLPFVAEPFGMQPGSDTWRCVQACLQRGPEGAVPPAPAAAAPEGLPPDAPPEAPAAPTDAAADAAADAAPDTPADAPAEEFEFQPLGRGGRPWGDASEGELAPGTMSLAAAIADPRSAGAGIYTIYKNGERLYVGRANALRRRLQQHLWCLTHLKLGVGRFSVKLTPMRGATPAQLGRVEAAVIDRFGRRSLGGQLANVKSREFEQAFEAWS